MEEVRLERLSRYLESSRLSERVVHCQVFYSGVAAARCDLAQCRACLAALAMSGYMLQTLDRGRELQGGIHED